MAKQPLASQPVTENPAGFSRKQFFLIAIVAAALLALLGLGYSQLGTAKAQEASPTNINFGNQLVGTTSNPPQTATFTNNTGYTATVSIANTNPTDFGVGGGCGGDLADGESCSVPVTFHPASAGAKTGAVNAAFTYTPSAVVPGAVKPNAVGTATVNLTGQGVPAPTATRVPAPCGSQIQGYVVIDGKPGAGIVVKLDGPTTAQVQVGEGGFFYFNNLCAGNFTLSVQYDATKYTLNTPGSYTIKTDGVNAYRDNAFGLVTIPATTAAPTTAVATTPAATTPAGTTPAGTTPPATTTTVAASCPAGPATPSGIRLRVQGNVVKVSDTQYLVCIAVAAGDTPVNLNDTVIVNLPAGTTTQATANQGTVTTSGTSIRWGSFSLNAKQTANLVLSVNAPSGNLNGSSIFVSGSFNRSQAFQQRIPGLTGIFDIVPAVQTNTGGGSTGGQGGGSPSVPSQAPATGAGADSDQQSPVLLLVLAIVASACLGIFGLFLTGRGKRPSNKEQK